jgi:uncharacterized protein YbjQ (UPF0145 family)
MGIIKGVFQMKNVKIAVGILLVLGLILSSCATPQGNVTKQPGWSEYTFIPSKNYTVVGAVVVRSAEGFRTLNADLMEAAIKLGAHDIINVRIDYESTSSGQRFLAGSAVAIKYNDQTLMQKTIDKDKGTTLEETYVSVGSDGSGGGNGGGSSGKKKVLGIF